MGENLQAAKAKFSILSQAIKVFATASAWRT
jgi:hypothetical protein